MSTKAKATIAITRNHFIIRIILTTLLVITVAINCLATFALWRDDSYDSNYQYGSLIMDAVDARNNPLVVDPQTNLHYIPAARLVLPAPGHSLGQVVYSHGSASDGTVEEVSLASKALIRGGQTAIWNANGDVEKVSAAIPELQACARGVRITFATDGNPAFTKTLADGRMAYFYTEKACYSQELADYAKQVNSY